MSDDERQLRLSAMVAHHTDRAIMILDPTGIIEWVNPGFTKLMGYSAAEVVAKPSNFLHGYGAESTSGKLIEQRIRAGVGADVELLHYTKSGDPLWIRSEIRPVRNAGGVLEHFVVLEVDLLEEERAARKVREDEERWMLALEVNDVAVWDLDVTTHTVMGSKRWAELLGIGEADLKIDACPVPRELFHPDELPRFLQGWQSLLDGTQQSLETGIQLRVGSNYRYMRLRGRVVRRDAAGAPLRVVGTLVDIHEARLMQIQAAHASKLESIGELAAGIAHEINTPTQYVGDNVRFLGDAFESIQRCIDELTAQLARSGEAVPCSSLREQLDRVDMPYLRGEIPKAIGQSLDGIQRIAKIVGAMKEFSHPGQERTPTDINHAIANTITVATNEWKYVAKVETDLDATLPAVPVVPGEFNQVILNIIVNAAQAIAETRGPDDTHLGRIFVATRRGAEWAEIEISDSGCGMPRHVQERIFDPFFTTKPVGKGTGQGLSIAHNVIVKKHRGSILVNSEPGRGTTFTIRLPLEINERAENAA
jgi:two-component system NtrC family sensor kinase